MRDVTERERMRQERIAAVVELLELGDRPAVKSQAARTLDAYCRLVEEEFGLGRLAMYQPTERPE